jgi:integrase
MVPMLDQPGPRKRIVTTTQLTVLLAHASPALQLTILLCHDCALRAGTATKLTAANFNPATRTITARTKRSRTVQVVCTARVANLIAQALHMRTLNPAKTDATLCSLLTPSRKPLTYDALLHQFHAAQTAAGLTNIRFHDLRRTMAINVYRLTRDLHAVKALLTHTHLNSTMWYLEGEAEMPAISILEQAALHQAERENDESRQ